MRNYDLKNPVHMVRCIAREKYAWPGGYELCGIMDDGALLCSGCVRENYKNILDSTKKDISDGWKIIGIINESELENDYCSHCNERLGYHEDSRCLDMMILGEDQEQYFPGYDGSYFLNSDP